MGLPSDVRAGLPAGSEGALPAVLARPSTGPGGERSAGEPGGDPGTTGGRPVVVAIPPADISPIPGAQDFFKILRIHTLAAGANYTAPELLLQIPRGAYATVQFVSIFVNSPTTGTNLVWTLLINQAPVPGFDNLTFSPRLAASFERGFGADVRVPDGAKISLRIQNNGAGPEDVGASYGGWYWDKNNGERYTGLPFLYVR